MTEEKRLDAARYNELVEGAVDAAPEPGLLPLATVTVEQAEHDGETTWRRHLLRLLSEALVRAGESSWDRARACIEEAREALVWDVNLDHTAPVNPETEAARAAFLRAHRQHREAYNAIRTAREAESAAQLQLTDARAALDAEVQS